MPLRALLWPSHPCFRIFVLSVPLVIFHSRSFTCIRGCKSLTLRKIFPKRFSADLHFNHISIQEFQANNLQFVSTSLAFCLNMSNLCIVDLTQGRNGPETGKISIAGWTRAVLIFTSCSIASGVSSSPLRMAERQAERHCIKYVHSTVFAHPGTTLGRQTRRKFFREALS